MAFSNARLGFHKKVRGHWRVSQVVTLMRAGYLVRSAARHLEQILVKQETRDPYLLPIVYSKKKANFSPPFAIT